MIHIKFLNFIITVFLALTVRAVALLVIFRIGLLAISSGQISFGQSFMVAAMLIIATFDMSAEFKGQLG